LPLPKLPTLEGVRLRRVQMRLQQKEQDEQFPDSQDKEKNQAR
jgi:hypothetical protein